MKLSEAIVKGAALRPQAFNGYYFSHGCSCALGAAYEAVSGKNPERPHHIDTGVLDNFDILNSKTTCPACDIKNRSVFYLALHLNDDHRWTREQIAEWVATVEQD